MTPGAARRRVDNAEAESLIGLYKTECTKREDPWKGVDDLELATLGCVSWFNDSRLHSSLGYVPPIGLETEHYRRNDHPQQPLTGELALHESRGGSVSVTAAP